MTDASILTMLGNINPNDDLTLDEKQKQMIKKPDVVKNLVHDILANYGATAVVSRRKTTVNVTDFIAESKNVMSHLPAFLRVAASLIRVSFKFASFILKKYGAKSSLSYQVKGTTNATVISYKDFVAFHEYVLKVRVLKIAKYNTFSRKRITKGVAASFNPVFASSALKKAMAAIVLPKGLEAYQTLLDYCKGSIVSRGLVSELIRGVSGPGDTTGTQSLGRYIKYAKRGFLDNLVRAVVPFSKETIELTDEQQEINKAARVRVAQDNFFMNVLSSGKKKVSLKPIFKASTKRILGDGTVTFFGLISESLLDDDDYYYLPSTSLTSLIACHTLPLGDIAYLPQLVESKLFPKSLEEDNLKDAVDQYKEKSGDSPIEELRAPEQVGARVEAFQKVYARIIEDNKTAATEKARAERVAKSLKKGKLNKWN